MTRWVVASGALLLAALRATSVSAQATDVERLGITTFQDACLSSPIAEQAIPAWAGKVNATPSPTPEHSAVVIGQHKQVWRVMYEQQIIYVALTARLGCTVWFTTPAPGAAVEAFRSLVQAEASRADPSSSGVKVFREGQVAPNLTVLAYKIMFPGLKVGLLWSVYVYNTTNSSTVWFEAQRVRSEA